MPPLVRLLRLHQWTKNLLVWAPFLFTSSWAVSGRTQSAFMAFAAFCLVSSAVYVFNDLIDVERDRNHPKKRLRPIASGKVSSGTAIVLGIVCLALGLTIGFTANPGTGVILLVYLLIQLAYNLGIKHTPVADVFAVSSGFVLRAIAGAVAIGVAVSGWLFTCTAMIALFLGFAKRRGELIASGDGGTREVLLKYNRAFLDQALTVTATGTLVSYAVYTISSETAIAHRDLVLTLPIVCYALFRYLFLALSKDEGAEPDVLLFRDPHLVISLLAYVAVVIYAMTRTSSQQIMSL